MQKRDVIDAGQNTLLDVDILGIFKGIFRYFRVLLCNIEYNVIPGNTIHFWILLDMKSSRPEWPPARIFEAHRGVGSIDFYICIFFYLAGD